MQPVRRRTWAPRGQTPVQRAWDRYDRLSVIGAVAVSPQRRRLGFYFQVWPENIRTDEMELFLTAMHHYYRRPVILVWDRYSVHRSTARRLRRKHAGWFDIEWLPPYAPELNPMEQGWNHTKYADLSNFMADDVQHLEKTITSAMGKHKRNQPLLRSFFQYAKLRL